MTLSVFLLYVGLALMMSIIITVLPSTWRIGKWHIVVWPLYAAWGIGWVMTGLWFYFEWDWYQYFIIAVVFHVCFPLIFVGAQLNHSLRDWNLQ